MSGIDSTIIIVLALFLAKVVYHGISWRIEDRRFMAGLDPSTRRFWEAAPEYSRLKESDPIAAERFMQNLVEEIRSTQAVEAIAGSGGHDDRTAPRQPEPISKPVPSKHPIGFVGLILDLSMLGYMAFRIPGPAIPALIAAGIAQFHSGIPRPRSLEDYLALFLTARDNSSKTIFWGFAGGAIGYGVLAALGIGVPAPEADLGWRIIGGLVFGAAAGILVGWIVSTVPMSYNEFRSSL
jgi:hypothetical protein